MTHRPSSCTALGLTLHRLCDAVSPSLLASLLPTTMRVSAVSRAMHSVNRYAKVDHASRRVALRTLVDAADALALECLHDGAIDQASDTFRSAFRQAVEFAGDVAAVRLPTSTAADRAQRRALVNAESLQDALALAGGAPAVQSSPASIALRRAMGSGGSPTPLSYIG